VIYNPAYNEGIDRDWTVPDHPWYSQGQPAIVLGVGRLVRQKNFMNLLDAFARVRTQRPARLIILGKGPLRTELLAHARNLGIAADVSLPGFIHHPYSYMRHANVFVLSSDWEGFGNVIVEAMANGCPVVSTDCPSGPNEILDGGRYGPLVPVNAPSALAEAILKVLAQPIEKKLLQARASEFSIKSAANAYLEMLLREPTPQPTAKVTT
jgi:glycosyltransferase involved in cell wall biosynthesis